jgi:hypothetical protein
LRNEVLLRVVEVLVVSGSVAETGLFVRREVGDSWCKELRRRLHLRIELIVDRKVLKLLVEVVLALRELVLLRKGAELVNRRLRTLHLLHPSQAVQFSLQLEVAHVVLQYGRERGPLNIEA